jgi:hypothetical protein
MAFSFILMTRNEHTDLLNFVCSYFFRASPFSYFYRNKLQFDNKQKRKSIMMITSSKSQQHHFRTKLLFCDQIRDGEMIQTFNVPEGKYILLSESLKGS